MSGLYLFKLGLYQKRFGGNNQIAGVSINLGKTKCRGSSTRMLNYCRAHSKYPSECINQISNIENISTHTPRHAQWCSLVYETNIGLNGTVLSIAIDSNNNVYAGGSFTTAGGVTVNNIAKWDGSTWSALVYETNIGLNGTVLSIAIDSNNNVYAGGIFTTAGGVTVNNIAKWDGSLWSALGSGTSIGQVISIAIDSNNTVYAGGIFTTAGDVTVNNIAKWDGSLWYALGDGVNGSVRTIAIDSNNNVYAGGSFTTAGGNNIATWDGSAWSYLGSGAGGIVLSIAIDSNNNVYAGGGFTTAGGVTVNKISKWDGSLWYALGSGIIVGTVISIAIDSNNTVYAGGIFTTACGVTVNNIATWDGSAWTYLGTGVNGAVRTIAIDSNNDVYAGGNFTTTCDGVQTVNRISKWG